MPPFSPRSSRQIADAMLARLIARSSLTDMIEDDDTYALLYAVASEIAGVEYKAWSFRESFDITNPDMTEEDFNARAAELPGKQFQRKGAAAAAGSVMSVTREDSSTVQVLPAGTAFGRTDSDATYRTTVDLTFDLGTETLNKVYVECVIPGSSGNCGVGVISRVLQAPSWLISGYNTAPLTNGSDAELLSQAQARAAKYLSALGGSQKAALEYLAESFVSSANVQARAAKGFYDPMNPKLATLVVDDGSGTSATVGVSSLSGTVPPGGQTIIAHPGPATGPLSVRVTRAGGAVELLTEEAGQIVSVYEQGYVYIPSARPWSLKAGDVWQIDAFEIYVGFLSELQLAVCGDVNDPIGTPGWQAFGCRVVVRPPDVYWLQADIHVVPVNGIDLEVAKSLVLTAIGAFTQQLGPGEPLYISQLLAAILQNPAILDVKLFERGISPVVALNDRYPAETQVIRTTPDYLQFIPSAGA